MRTLAIFVLCLLLSPDIFATTCTRPAPDVLFATADFIFEANALAQRKI